MTDRDAHPRCGIQIDIVQTDCEVTDRGETWRSSYGRLVETVADHAEDAVAMNEARAQFLGWRWRVVVP